MICVYCQKARGIHDDHIMSSALRRRFPDWADTTVPACLNCNLAKGTRHLIPPSWSDRLKELEELTGKKWKVWRGDAESLRQVIR